MCSSDTVLSTIVLTYMWTVSVVRVAVRYELRIERSRSYPRRPTVQTRPGVRSTENVNKVDVFLRG